jgi:hypothetical protein
MVDPEPAWIQPDDSGGCMAAAGRILAVSERDTRNPAFRRGPDMLHDMTRAAFADLDAFERFEPCMVKSRSVEQAQDKWFPVCDHQTQETGLSRSREPR